MSQITRENIEIKANKCDAITNKYIAWIEKFKDLRTGKFSISDILYDQVFQKKELIDSLMNLTAKKPSIAIYGASQSGKSLFIGRLLKSKETVLLNPDPPGLDFLTHLNPSRGVEATSVVTRFTISSTSTTVIWYG